MVGVPGYTPILLRYNNAFIYKKIEDIAEDWGKDGSPYMVMLNSYKVHTNSGWQQLINVKKYWCNETICRVRYNQGIIDISESNVDRVHIKPFNIYSEHECGDYITKKQLNAAYSFNQFENPTVNFDDNVFHVKSNDEIVLPDMQTIDIIDNPGQYMYSLCTPDGTYNCGIGYTCVLVSQNMPENNF